MIHSPDALVVPLLNLGNLNVVMHVIGRNRISLEIFSGFVCSIFRTSKYLKCKETSRKQPYNYIDLQ